MLLGTSLHDCPWGVVPTCEPLVNRTHEVPVTCPSEGGGLGPALLATSCTSGKGPSVHPSTPCWPPSTRSQFHLRGQFWPDDTTHVQRSMWSTFKATRPQALQRAGRGQCHTREAQRLEHLPCRHFLKLAREQSAGSCWC